MNESSNAKSQPNPLLKCLRHSTPVFSVQVKMSQSDSTSTSTITVSTIRKQSQQLVSHNPYKKGNLCLGLWVTHPTNIPTGKCIRKGLDVQIHTVM